MVKRIAPVVALVIFFAWHTASQGEKAAPEPASDDLRAAFEKHTGVKLVFDSRDLPPGSYFEILPSLNEEGRRKAAQIALREVQKYPRGYLGSLGIKGIGIFQACASKQGDGFRPYDKTLEGYRYYGIWNGKDGIAAAYYSDRQLPLTIHHEIFHHIDGTLRGKVDASRLRHDDAFNDALSGKRPHAAIKLSADDLDALKKAGSGGVLEGAVSEYCKKSIGEDKAETARHFMTNLADCLVQMATRPNLAGSQRMLHILQKYEAAAPENGPGLDWFVDVALGRTPEKPIVRRPVPHRNMVETEKPDSPAALPMAPRDPAELLKLLRSMANPGASGYDGVKDRALLARSALEQVEQLQPDKLAREDAKQLFAAAASVTQQLLRERLQPRNQDRQFAIWGKEDTKGINWTLREDVLQMARDGQRLKTLAAFAPEEMELLVRGQLQYLRLLGRYYAFIAGKWKVTEGTKQVFENARELLVGALPETQAELAKKLALLELKKLGDLIPSDGKPELRSPAVKKDLDNPYISKVDEAIENPEVRAAIRAVQPACVRVHSGGSGVNLAPEGRVLTNAHVASKLKFRTGVTFPDGRSFDAVCTAIDYHFDLAILTLDNAANLPFAPVCKHAPETGTRIVCIGQPGGRTPKGEATNYKAFHVSTGRIRGVVDDDPLGSHSPIGRLKHDAWTYWGHSGSPLFNEQGQLSGLHSSWDSKTAMRHGVTHQGIVKFLEREKVPFSFGD